MIHTRCSAPLYMHTFCAVVFGPLVVVVFFLLELGQCNRSWFSPVLIPQLFVGKLHYREDINPLFRP